jgi:ribosomal-protein-serine acetyltransferase
MSAAAAHGRIVIRPLTTEDTDALLAAVAASIRTLSQWLPWATPAYAREDAAAWIAHSIAVREADEEYHFGVFDAASGDVLGGVGLNHRIRAYRTANMGYWVADAARGRGVAVAAARQAARFGFETLGLQRIAILVQPDNRASLRVAVKLGAVCEGIARNGIIIAGRPHEAMVHSLLPEDLSPIVAHSAVDPAD